MNELASIPLLGIAAGLAIGVPKLVAKIKEAQAQKRAKLKPIRVRNR